MTVSRSLVLALALVLLAGCHKKPAPTDDKRSAAGEVLEGSTSDDMIPLEQLQSKPPLLKPSASPTTPEEIDDAEAASEDGGPATAVPDSATPAPASGN